VGGGVPGQAGGLGAGLGPDALPEGLRSPLGPRGEAPGPGEGSPAGTSGTSVPWLSALKLLDNLGLAPTFVRFEAHVIKYLEFYKDERRGRSIMASWLRKQGRYKALIEQALDKYGLPRFLLYVAMIESGFDPHDRSHKGAVGLWQFMPEGARIYGLRVDYWVDERQDPVRSTEAAARYLGDLKARFGSWHLALAAFNAGYGAVLRAMQKYNTNDYWELCRHEDGLPWETLLYVPKAIATALVGENKGFFGYEEVAADPPVSFDGVPVASSVSLASAARAIGIPVEDLARINPHLRRGRTPPLKPGETWELRLPAGTAERFSRSPESRGEPGSEKLVAHVVRFGERIEDIAKQRGVSASLLRRINGLVSGDDQAEIRTGVTLLVPERPDRQDHAERARPEPPAPLTPEEIVIVAVPDKDAVVPGKKRVFYRVIPGDSIWAIARFFKVRDADLMRWNNLDPEATLATKMVLDIWVDKDFDTSSAVLVDPARVRVVTTGSEEFFELVEALRGRRRQKVTCQSGDTWEKLAKRCGLTVSDLERINRVGRGTELRPGQTVVVYHNLSASERAEALRKLLPGVHIASSKEPDRAPRPSQSGDHSGDKPTSKSADRAGDPDKDRDPDGEAGREAPAHETTAALSSTAAPSAAPSSTNEAAAPVGSGPPAERPAASPPPSSARSKAAPAGAVYGPPRPWRSPTGPALPAPAPAKPAEPYGPPPPPLPPKEEVAAERSLPPPPPLPPELPAPPPAPVEPSGPGEDPQTAPQTVPEAAPAG
jgi:membrane-bound lytic murein transglycosylase D